MFSTRREYLIEFNSPVTVYKSDTFDSPLVNKGAPLEIVIITSPERNCDTIPSLVCAGADCLLHDVIIPKMHVQMNSKNNTLFFIILFLLPTCFRHWHSCVSRVNPSACRLFVLIRSTGFRQLEKEGDFLHFEINNLTVFVEGFRSTYLSYCGIPQVSSLRSPRQTAVFIGAFPYAKFIALPMNMRKEPPLRHTRP